MPAALVPGRGGLGASPWHGTGCAWHWPSFTCGRGKAQQQRPGPGWIRRPRGRRSGSPPLSVPPPCSCAHGMVGVPAPPVPQPCAPVPVLAVGPCPQGPAYAAPAPCPPGALQPHRLSLLSLEDPVPPCPPSAPAPRSLQHQRQQLHHLHSHVWFLVEHHGHHAGLARGMRSVTPCRDPGDPHGPLLTLKRLVKSSMWAAVSRWQYSPCSAFTHCRRTSRCCRDRGCQQGPWPGPMAPSPPTLAPPCHAGSSRCT